MNTETLNNELNDFKEYISTLPDSIEGEFFKKKLMSTFRQIKSDIWEIERENRNSEKLVEKEIDGFNVKIPISLSLDEEEYEIKVVDGVLYKLTKGKDKEDFHVWSYAIIPNEDGWIELVVRILGGDTYGDRIFTESRYYKKYESDYPYYSKDYGKNQRYPRKFDEYVKVIIDEFNKLLDVNDSFKPFNK